MQTNRSKERKIYMKINTYNCVLSGLKCSEEQFQKEQQQKK